jgi:hypothetical protein
MNKNKWLHALAYLSLVFICQSCTITPEADVMATAEITTTVITLDELATNTRTPVITRTPIITLTQTVSPPDLKATARSIMEWTPEPTLNRSNARSAVVQLIENNADCRLPCWWGITPGETTWEEARNVIQPLAAEWGQMGPYFYEPINPSTVSITYTFSFEITDYTDVGGGSLDADLNSKITWLRISPYLTKQMFSLPKLLNEYGKPDEIYMEVTPDVPGNNQAPFVMILSYPERNFMARFTLEAFNRNGIVTGCVYATTSPRLSIWASGVNVTDRTIQTFIGGGDRIFFRRIEEVTDETIDTFFEKFSTMGNSMCIASDASNW